MKRILLLRSGDIEDAADTLRPEVDLLVTHEVLPLRKGIAEALAFEPEGSTLIVTSRSTVRVLREARADFFGTPFAGRVAAGEGTARALMEAGASDVMVPDRPGAAGIVELLDKLGALRILWPHGSDADTTPFDALEERGVRLAGPVVYEKRPALELDPERIEALYAGRYAGVAVSSLAALDVLLAAARADGRPLPQVRWGAIGPGTAWGLVERHLPAPVVPSRARLTDLIDALDRALREESP